MYHDLDVLLILALIKREHGAKAMYKKAVQMVRGKVKVEPKVVHGILKVLTSPNSPNFASRKLDEFIEDYLYYALPAREIGAEKGVGMVIYKDQVYPIHVTYETSSDYWWSVENETEIYTAAIFWLIWEHGVTDIIEAEFLMFTMYGFKGIPRWWCVKNIGGEVSYQSIVYTPNEGECTPDTFTYQELVAINNRKSELESNNNI